MRLVSCFFLMRIVVGSFARFAVNTMSNSFGLRKIRLVTFRYLVTRKLDDAVSGGKQASFGLIIIPPKLSCKILRVLLEGRERKACLVVGLIFL